MKKLLIIFALACTCFVVMGQASTLTDYGTRYKIYYDGTGDMFTIYKGIFVVENDSSVVSLVSPQDQRPRDHRPFLVLDPTDFGYSSAQSLDSTLSRLNDPNGYVLKQNKATNPDTIFYLDPWDTTDTLGISRYGYNANDSLTTVYPFEAW